MQSQLGECSNRSESDSTELSMRPKALMARRFKERDNLLRHLAVILHEMTITSDLLEIPDGEGDDGCVWRCPAQTPTDICSPHSRSSSLLRFRVDGDDQNSEADTETV
eukprot:759570-Hanusia_phi.AAC.9